MGVPAGDRIASGGHVGETNSRTLERTIHSDGGAVLAIRLYEHNPDKFLAAPEAKPIVVVGAEPNRCKFSLELAWVDVRQHRLRGLRLTVRIRRARTCEIHFHDTAPYDASEASTLR